MAMVAGTAKEFSTFRQQQPNGFSVVSFFSGCGGLDLGMLGGFIYKGMEFSRTPFNIIAAYDIEEKCIQTYTLNIGDHIKILDLSKANPSEMPKATVLMGGFPCQDFSSCGPKAGLDSERGQLYQALVGYMRLHRPLVVVAENVPHLAKMNGGDVLNAIVADLESVGYRFDVWRLEAPDYGVPQNRTRLFFIGVREDIPGMPVQPSATHKGAHRSIDWAIHDLLDVTDESVPNQSQYFKASKAKRGNGQGDEQNKAGLPSYTIRANAKSRIHFHYELPRRLTIRECARLQTFPDDFVFPYAATTNVMQIGNAVPPVLAYHVACSIATFLQSVEQGKSGDNDSKQHRYHSHSPNPADAGGNPIPAVAMSCGTH